jgi:pyruvoyl-dependent arginine decarboxylase
MKPTKVFFTSGFGTHKENKNARDRASTEAGIGDINLLETSSILRPGIQVISRAEFEELIKSGQVDPGECLCAVNGVCESNVPGQKVCSGMAWVRPWDKSKTGYISELFEHPGIQEDIMKQRVETMALQLYADRRGFKGFSAENVWENGKKYYEINGEKVTLESMVVSEVCNIDGDYSVALVAAILIP